MKTTETILYWLNRIRWHHKEKTSLMSDLSVQMVKTPTETWVRRRLRWESSFIKGCSRCRWRKWINQPDQHINIQNCMSSKKFWIKRVKRKLRLLSCHQRNQQLDFKLPIQPKLTSHWITKCYKRSSTLIFLISNSSRRHFTTLSRLCRNLRSRVQHHQSARNNSSNPLRKWRRRAKSTLAEVLKTKTTFIASSWKSMTDLPDLASACHCINKLTWWSSFWNMK